MTMVFKKKRDYRKHLSEGIRFFRDRFDSFSSTVQKKINSLLIFVCKKCSARKLYSLTFLSNCKKKLFLSLKNFYSYCMLRKHYVKWFITEFVPAITFYGVFGVLFLKYNGIYPIDFTQHHTVFAIIAWGYATYFLKAELPKIILSCQKVEPQPKMPVRRYDE